MSIKQIENVIRRFLATPEPEAICITGRWGVGKTFAWNSYVRAAHKAAEIALSRYSYVSLFGINSVDELKFSVFENSIKTSEIGLSSDLESLQSKPIATIDSIARKSARRTATTAQQTPFLQSFLGGVAPIWFSSVKANIVCIDDFERRGENLPVRSVLGLANSLKELKRCKICLILNDEALEDDESEFRKYLEKVVDATLEFQPSPEECAQIALPEHDDISKLLAQYSTKLGISNIRVIKKIEKAIHQVAPLLSQFDKGVLRQAVHSLTIFGWSLHDPSNAPSINYLRSKNALDFSALDPKKPITPKEAAWNALLGSYAFISVDDFDAALLDGIQNGYFDPSSVNKTGSDLNDKIGAGKLDAAFNRAWRMYHDSFDDNQEQVMDAMYKALFEGAKYITM